MTHESWTFWSLLSPSLSFLHLFFFSFSHHLLCSTKSGSRPEIWSTKWEWNSSTMLYSPSRLNINSFKVPLYFSLVIHLWFILHPSLITCWIRYISTNSFSCLQGWHKWSSKGFYATLHKARKWHKVDLTWNDLLFRFSQHYSSGVPQALGNKPRAYPFLRKRANAIWVVGNPLELSW